MVILPTFSLFEQSAVEGYVIRFSRILDKFIKRYLGFAKNNLDPQCSKLLL